MCHKKPSHSREHWNTLNATAFVISAHARLPTLRLVSIRLSRQEFSDTPNTFDTGAGPELQNKNTYRIAGLQDMGTDGLSEKLHSGYLLIVFERLAAFTSAVQSASVFKSWITQWKFRFIPQDVCGLILIDQI